MPEYNDRVSVVYKYCNSQGVDILEALELKLTPPNQFNDPFEFLPRTICTNPKSRTKQILKDKHYQAEFAALAGFKGNRRELKRFVRAHREQWAAEFATALPMAGEEVCRDLVNKVSATWGLLCLSKTNESILMWGHYAESHRGIVIGFDGSHPVFDGLDDVKYVKQRVVFDTSWKPSNINTHAFQMRIVFSKNDEWSYEQEVRLFRELPTLKQHRQADGTVRYFLAFPPEALVSVALGWRCTRELQVKVKAALNKPELNHVQLQRASLHETEFKMVVA